MTWTGKLNPGRTFIGLGTRAGPVVTRAFSLSGICLRCHLRPLGLGGTCGGNGVRYGDELFELRSDGGH